MKIPESKLYKKNNQRLIPITHKKAIIVGYNVQASLADICFLDNLQTKIKGVPISDTVQTFLFLNNPAGGLVNRKCVVDIFDESNTSQMIIAYTY